MCWNTQHSNTAHPLLAGHAGVPDRGGVEEGIKPTTAEGGQLGTVPQGVSLGQCGGPPGLPNDVNNFHLKTVFEVWEWIRNSERIALSGDTAVPRNHLRVMCSNFSTISWDPKNIYFVCQKKNPALSTDSFFGKKLKISCNLTPVIIISLTTRADNNTETRP